MSDFFCLLIKKKKNQNQRFIKKKKKKIGNFWSHLSEHQEACLDRYQLTSLLKCHRGPLLSFCPSGYHFLQTYVPSLTALPVDGSMNQPKGMNGWFLEGRLTEGNGWWITEVSRCYSLALFFNEWISQWQKQYSPDNEGSGRMYLCNAWKWHDSKHRHLGCSGICLCSF